MKLSAAEQISLAISVLGTALSAFSFFHSPTVVAQVPSLADCHEAALNQAKSFYRSDQHPSTEALCYREQESSQDSRIYAKLREISRRLDKLEADAPQPQLHSSLISPKQSQLAAASHSPTDQQSVLGTFVSDSKLSNHLSVEKQLGTSSGKSSSLAVVSSKAESKQVNAQSKFQNAEDEAYHLVDKGEKHYQQQQLPQALQQFQQALTLYNRTGDRLGEATVLGWMATVYDQLGQYTEAEKLVQQELTLY